MGTLIHSQLVRNRGNNLIYDWYLKPKWESLEPLIYSRLVRSTSNNLAFQLVSGSREQQFCGTVECSVISGYTVSEFSWIVAHPDSVWELLVGVGKPPHRHRYTHCNWVQEPNLPAQIMQSSLYCRNSNSYLYVTRISFTYSGRLIVSIDEIVRCYYCCYYYYYINNIQPFIL